MNMSVHRQSIFTCAFVRTVRISAVCIHIAVTDVIFTFIQEKDLPPLAISQLINIAFPVPVGSSQYFPLMVFLPSLAFISRQDIAGNSGIEPKGAAVKIRVLFLNYRWERKRLAKYEENLKKQKSARHIDFWLLTSAVQSPDVKPRGGWKEILWSRLLGAVI